MSRQSGSTRAVVWAMSSALLLCACDTMNKPQGTVLGDSNTNWITCNGPTWCGGQLLCSCGVCTEACTSDLDCASWDGVCLPQSEVSACAGSEPVGRVCVPRGAASSMPLVMDAGTAVAERSEPDAAGPLWRVHASNSSMQEDETDLLFNPPEEAIDGVASTRWSSGKPQVGNEWFEVDFGASRTLSRVTLQLGLGSTVESMDDWPRGYSLSVSNQRLDRAAPIVAQGVGSAPVTEIQFPPQTGRYLLIRQTAASTAWWSIHELKVE